MREPRKFSQNPSSISGKRQTKDSFISSVTQNKKKSAAESASSILEELGVKKTSSSKTKKNSVLTVKKESTKKNNPNLDLELRGSRIIDDLISQKKINTKNKSVRLGNKKNDIENKQKNESNLGKNKTNRKPDYLTKNNDLHGKFVLFALSCVLGVAFLAYIGGYIKIFDLAVFRQIFTGNAHQLEFVGEFEARQVENGYNRVPLFVVEGTIRNSFFESDNIEKIQLKAFSFDNEQQLIESHFTYTDMVLSDEQLETLSPVNIKALRQSSNSSIINSLEKTESQSNTLENKSKQKNDLAFQVIFFKDVSMIHSTSIEIVSYVRNKKLVFLGSSNRN